jgi:phospholipid-binding lipoprotein MlaA
VLPLLGPSDVRDAVGLVPDSYTNPFSYVTPIHDRYLYYAGALIDTRAVLLDATNLIDQAALDRYQFTRDAWFQHRTSLQYEGNPPPPKLDEDDSGDAPAAPAGPKPAQPPPAPGR